MTRGARNVAVVGFVGLVLCAAMGAQLENQPQAHPIFQGLEVGQRIEIDWEEGGYLVRNWPGTKQIVALGPDYLAYKDSGYTYYVYINKIKAVVIRP